MNWNDVLHRLKKLPASVTNLAPPCPPERIIEEEVRLGTMPSIIVEMLHIFNGGELFIDATPFITIFGLSLSDDSPELDWSVDRFTPKWRAAMHRPNDWIVGISSYGGIFVIDENNFVREWDSAQMRWDDKRLSFDEWIEFLFAEGQACLDEK